MRGLNSLSGEEWGKPTRANLLGGIYQEKGRILVKETNPGAILRLGEGVLAGVV